MSSLLALALVFATQIPPGSTLDPTNKDAAFQQIGTDSGTVWYIAAAANTKYTLGRGHGKPACFPVGARVVLTSVGGGAIVHFTQTATMTFDATMTSNLGFQVSDAAGPDGRATGPMLPVSGSIAEVKTTFDQVYYGPGGRVDGICTVQLSCMGVKSWVPCRANGDCTDAMGVGTCDLSSDVTGRRNALRSAGAVFAIFQADTASTKITATVQK